MSTHKFNCLSGHILRRRGSLSVSWKADHFPGLLLLHSLHRLPRRFRIRRLDRLQLPLRLVHHQPGLRANSETRHPAWLEVFGVGDALLLLPDGRRSLVVHAGCHLVPFGWPSMGPRGHRRQGRLPPRNRLDFGIGANHSGSHSQEDWRYGAICIVYKKSLTWCCLLISQAIEM